ncbi:MAG: imidazolonepropionase [Clostridium sp.]|jgi:imidazolonepropionase|uniref:imidazolonepropionase n=1 Tax=Clostridium sp. TaxID=1506 RepID=UPI0025C4B11A|nr:imidazolonepropionase [Clostridium sp.]MCH3963451.1 imidazolonepropionase [Clostridium sp.]MCI1716681.1 imidazolonepropionase [Clostridium sp.]MCI1801135.1 imidazolonepropionase [Clostridium sp.]MCI1814867.1 imidazolonepropionase [Clostridium sp.]MCI1871768.1 imidazolonepropionase [Clostridium sp.]
MKNIIVLNADEIATPIGKCARFGNEMGHIKIIKHGTVVVENGRIAAVDTTQNILKKYDLRNYEILKAEGKCVVPGFVDSHTHFIFSGYRPDEFFMRLGGRSYMNIMKAGGGIENTVKATRKSSFKELYNLGMKRLDSMLSFGITTVEGKSGYGLDLETEIKQLKVMKELNKDHAVDVIGTFLGAHAVPEEFTGKSSKYIDFIIERVLPEVVDKKLAEFCDVFCEKGVISIELSKKLLLKASELGLKLKIHADEIMYLGGAELAGRLDAVSADHLLNASENGIELLSKNKVVATLLPATAFCLNKPYANARKMIDSGCAVALASDFNPGSCFSNSIPLIFALACIYMNMSAEEALTALTLNGAAALNRADTIGSIENGKIADMVILKYPGYKYLMYNTGVNIVDKVLKNGNTII